MTYRKAFNIIKTYNYWRGAEDNIGNVCVHPDYIESKKYYNLALDKIEKGLRVLVIIKKLLYIVEPDNEEELKEFDSVDYLRLKDYISRKAYKILKEWLENEI